MRLARKLFLVAAATIAMIAFASPAANAVTVTAEPGGANCPEVQVTNAHVITGGCLVSAATAAATSADLRTHFNAVGEVFLGRCTVTFQARIHRSGDGWIFNQVLGVPPVGTCGLAPCDEPASPNLRYEWPATTMEFGFTDPNDLAFQLTFCTRPLAGAPGSSFGTCTIFIPIQELPPVHSYQFQTLAAGPATPTV